MADKCIMPGCPNLDWVGHGILGVCRVHSQASEEEQKEREEWRAAGRKCNECNKTLSFNTYDLCYHCDKIETENYARMDRESNLRHISDVQVLVDILLTHGTLQAYIEDGY